SGPAPVPWARVGPPDDGSRDPHEPSPPGAHATDRHRVPAEEKHTMFGRKKNKPAAQDDAAAQPEAVPTAEDAAAARRREPAGPLDVSQVEDRDGYLDLGAVLVRPRPGLGVRLEMDERTQRPRAVALDLDGGSV